MSIGPSKNLAENLILLFSPFLLLTFVDIVVVSWMVEPVGKEYEIPWSKFETEFWPFQQLFIWHIALMPLAFGFYGLLGFAKKSWRLAVAGNILFFGGLEDIVFFLFQRQLIPAELPWLDHAPLIIWVKIFTQNPHVTTANLWIAAIFNLSLALIILFWKRNQKTAN